MIEVARFVFSLPPKSSGKKINKKGHFFFRVNSPCVHWPWDFSSGISSIFLQLSFLG